MPTDSYYIIMTHDHQLDFDLCCAILKRGDARFIGLIGSSTKWLRFKKRLKLKGFDQRQIDQIQCPVGLDSVPGKRPMEVAVSVASEIIADYHRKQYRETEFDQKSQGKAWQQLAQQQISSLDASSDTGKTRSIDRSKACGGCDEC